MSRQKAISLAIEHIVLDERLQPREALNSDHLEVIAGMMRDGGQLQEPVVAEVEGWGRGEMRLVAGWHRVAAAKMAGLTEIRVLVAGTMTPAEAVIKSAYDNADNVRLPMTPADRRRAVAMVLPHTEGETRLEKVTKIAKALRCSLSTVNRSTRDMVSADTKQKNEAEPTKTPAEIDSVPDCNKSQKEYDQASADKRGPGRPRKAKPEAKPEPVPVSDVGSRSEYDHEDETPPVPVRDEAALLARMAGIKAVLLRVRHRIGKAHNECEAAEAELVALGCGSQIGSALSRAKQGCHAARELLGAHAPGKLCSVGDHSVTCRCGGTGFLLHGQR